MDWRDTFCQRFGLRVRPACGDGWRQLIESLVIKLDALKIPYEVMQVKEKFGGLRFRFNLDEQQPEDVWEKFHDLVSKTEQASYGICEFCAEPAVDVKAWNNWWVRAHCQKCGDQASKEGLSWRPSSN